MTGRLRNLADQATPGPWVFMRDGDIHMVCTEDYGGEVVPWNEGVAQVREPDARLIALAPDMARLLSDMAAFVAGETPDDECDVPGCTDPWCCDHDAEALLARFRELEERAG